MAEIIFKAAFDGKPKTARLFQPSGAASSNYYLMIDSYVFGQINKMSDGWRVYFNKPDEFTKDDADILIEIVRQNPII